MQQGMNPGSTEPLRPNHMQCTRCGCPVEQVNRGGRLVRLDPDGQVHECGTHMTATAGHPVADQVIGKTITGMSLRQRRLKITLSNGAEIIVFSDKREHLHIQHVS